MLATSRQNPSVLALMMSPSDVTFGQAGSASGLLAAGLSGASAVPLFGTIAPLIQDFLSARPQKAGPTFFSYQSADEEFGWTWYNAPDATVEGTHRCAVLLRTKSAAAYVRLTIEVATDWNRFGVWTRTYTFLVPMAPQTPTPHP